MAGFTGELAEELLELTKIWLEDPASLDLAEIVFDLIVRCALTLDGVPADQVREAARQMRASKAPKRYKKALEKTRRNVFLLLQ